MLQHSTPPKPGAEGAGTPEMANLKGNFRGSAGTGTKSQPPPSSGSACHGHTTPQHKAPPPLGLVKEGCMQCMNSPPSVPFRSTAKGPWRGPALQALVRHPRRHNRAADPHDGRVPGQRQRPARGHAVLPHLLRPCRLLGLSCGPFVTRQELHKRVVSDGVSNFSQKKGYWQRLVILVVGQVSCCLGQSSRCHCFLNPISVTFLGWTVFPLLTNDVEQTIVAHSFAHFGPKPNSGPPIRKSVS